MALRTIHCLHFQPGFCREFVKQTTSVASMPRIWIHSFVVLLPAPIIRTVRAQEPSERVQVIQSLRTYRPYLSNWLSVIQNYHGHQTALERSTGSRTAYLTRKSPNQSTKTKELLFRRTEQVYPQRLQSTPHRQYLTALVLSLLSASSISIADSLRYSKKYADHPA